MGNETSTEGGAQFVSPDESQTEDILGLLSLEQETSFIGNDEENPTIIPSETAGKEDADSHGGSLPQNGEASDTYTTDKGVTLDESDNSRNATSENGVTMDESDNSRNATSDKGVTLDESDNSRNTTSENGVTMDESDNSRNATSDKGVTLDESDNSRNATSDKGVTLDESDNSRNTTSENGVTMDESDNSRNATSDKGVTLDESDNSRNTTRANGVPMDDSDDSRKTASDKGVTLDESDNSRNTVSSKARASPVPVSPVPETKDDGTLNASGEEEKPILSKAPKEPTWNGETSRENSQKSESNPAVSNLENGDKRINHALHPPAVTKTETADKLILLKAPGITTRKGDRNRQNGQESASNAIYPVATNTEITKPKMLSQEKKIGRNRSQIFSEGHLKGTLERINENNVCRDPLLKAVAAGSAVRRQKHQRKMQSRARVFSNNNEWKMSLRRLARTAASTAKTVASATAPVISDASQVILSSATDFAQDVKKEWEKEHKQLPETDILLSHLTEEEKNIAQNAKKEWEKEDNRPPETEIITSHLTDEEKNIAQNAKKEWEKEDNRPPEPEIFMSPTNDEDKDNTSGFFDAMDEVGMSFETAKSASFSLELENDDQETSERTFDEKKETDNLGQSDEHDLPTPRTCIYEELQDMEKDFDAQIKSVLASQSFTEDDKTDHDLSNTDHDFSERSTEIDLIEKSESSDRQIIATKSIEEQIPESSEKNDTDIGEESTTVNENQIDSDGNDSDRLRDKDEVVHSTPQVRTRSGRVVKPVRRLVDGYETSAWEENQYGSTDQQITNDGAVDLVGESENSSLDPEKSHLVQSPNLSKYDEEEESKIDESGLDIKDTSPPAQLAAESPDLSKHDEEEESKIDESGIDNKDTLPPAQLAAESPEHSKQDEEEELNMDESGIDNKDTLPPAQLAAESPELSKHDEEEELNIDESGLDNKDTLPPAQLAAESPELSKHDEEEESKIDESGIDNNDTPSLAQVAAESPELSKHDEEEESRIDESGIENNDTPSLAQLAAESPDLSKHDEEEESKIDESGIDNNDASPHANADNTQLVAKTPEIAKCEGKRSNMDEAKIDSSTVANASNLQLAAESPKASKHDGKDSKIDEDGTDINGTSSHANTGILSPNPNSSQLAVEESQIGESGINNIDTFSHIPSNSQTANPYIGTTELLTVPGVTNDDLRRKKNPTFGEVKRTSSHLFDTNEESIYQSEDIDTMKNGTGTSSTEESEKNALTMLPEQEAAVKRLDELFFKDGKSAVKYVVTKLTGYDIQVKDKTDKYDLFDPTSINDYPIVESVFENEIEDDVEVLSSSSFSSPPEIDMSCQKEEKDPQDTFEEDMNELLPMFDFIPAKREITQTINTVEDGIKGKSNVVKENVRKRRLFKQPSNASIKDSLASFSTHERGSKNSNPSSRRSGRRLRRQGSRLSLALSNTQLSNTQSTKSPYETPIENRSLVDGKQQIEANSIDHGGQMVRWDTDMEAQFPSVPDTEEMTEALERSELFHDTLASFSSLENIDFLKDFPFRKSTEVPKPLASLVWRQLVANWKHSESCKAMLTRPASIQLTESTRHTETFDVDDDLSSSVSAFQLRLGSRNVELPNFFLSSDSYSLLRCLHDGSGYDIINNGIVILTRFLCSVGPGLSSSVCAWNSANGESSLRHDLSITLEDDKRDGTLNITEIQTEAKKRLKSLERVIDRIVKYSTQNGSTATDIECNDITYSCGVKDYAAIRNKARRKYGGDVSLVKDVLRGQITFPDEGSLICGLCFLYNIAGSGGEGNQGETIQSSPAFQIVRLKNLFQSTGVSEEISTALPTGYRHILINVKFDCGLIAELQFQLAQLFEIMGDEGYSLHQEIVSSQINKINGSYSEESDNVKNSTKNSTKSENDFPFDVSTSSFVHLILTTSNPPTLHSQPGRKVSSNVGESDVSFSSAPTPTSNNVPKGGIGALAAQAALKKAQDKKEKSKVSGSKATPGPPAGGIAALAAQAALKKAKDNFDKEEPSVPPAGGIAALAAQAASKKSQKASASASDEEAPATPTGGGIAALAAQAALKKSKEKQSPAPSSGGGIAALAAQAALKKSKEKQSTAPPTGGGIAALAAQAALKKSQKTSEENPPAPLPGGGIAALAAQAALKKSQKMSEENPPAPPTGGGIAALAAQAALKKSQEKRDKGDSPAPPPVGGIAALAAQAALKKSQEKLDKEEPPVSPTSGGIAALAAQAALKKSQKELEKTPLTPPIGGIADVTSQVALKKSEEDSRKEILFTPPVSIAELAAESDLKKENENIDEQKPFISETGGDIAFFGVDAASEKSGNSPNEILFTPPISIAALAAESASKKSEENANIEGVAALAEQAASIQSEENSPNEILFTPPGGIASLAAQAALKKSQEKIDKEEEYLAPSTGGVAALAAQAALKQSQEKPDKENEPLTLPTGGGIAALAAQAALKKSQEKINKKEETLTPTTEGGIAALAAQAALKKSQAKMEKEADSPAPPTGGGIAALAAQAALKKSQEKINKKEETLTPTTEGGIAALAAQAALKKSQAKMEKEADSPVPPTGGGIAALAAQAALKKSQKMSEENPAPPTGGGIAALAAQAALKKSNSESNKVGTPPDSAGSVAALAASGALKKLDNGVTTGALLNPSGLSDEQSDLNSVSYSLPMLLTAVLETGILDAISNPRDVPAFCCLHLLASSLQEHDSSLSPSERDKGIMLSEELSTFSRRLLLRSLSISNQATSIGMIGWLEYGSRDLIDRTLILPLEVLKQLSCNMAAAKEWEKASDVLCSLWLRCEQNLPRCHPTTICAMLDLAGALSETKNTDSAKYIISQALDLFTKFLSEVESLFFDRRYFELYCNDPNRRRVVFLDDCIDAVGIMKAFSKGFHKDLSRDFLEHLGRKHPVTLLNHSLVADSFLVLANCLSASEEEMDTNMPGSGDRNGEPSSRYFWSLAQSQYDLALRGWISLESLIHPNAASITFSIARCLRELGKLKQAVKLLETLASCLEQKLDEEVSATRTKSRYPKATKAHSANMTSPSKRTFMPLNKEPSSSPKDCRPSFISRRRLRNSNPSSPSKNTITTESCEREQTAALCFWMMAVLTAEQNPDELGRNRALSLLHTASLTLQRVLNNIRNSSNAVDNQTFQTCLDLYERIEGEALDLFEPLERIPLVKDFEVKEENTIKAATPRKKRAPWEILTPMRQKRDWISPRSRINQNRTAGSLGTARSTFFE